MTEACFALDLNWKFSFVNNRGAELLRHDRAALLGRSFWEVVPQVVGSPFEGHYRRTMEERQPVAFEAYSQNAGHWLDVRLFPTAEGLAAFLLDISDRKRAEETMRSQQELLRETGHIAKVGGWEFNAETGEGTWTEEVARIHGLDPTAKPDRTSGLDYYVGESRPGIERAVQTAVAQGTPYDLELQLRAADGVLKWVRTIGRPVFRDGRVVAVRGSFQDITDRKLAEAAVRESEERLQTVVEHLTEGLVISDFAGNLLQWNRAGLEMHGFSSLEEGRQSLPHFSETFELATLEGTVLSVAEWPLTRIMRGETVRDVEIRVARRDRDWSRIFSYSGAIVREANGQQVAFVSVTDITTRKRTEWALREANERLEQKVAERTAELNAAKERAESADRLKSEFLATMSHELRTPLNGILGFTELLVDGRPGPVNPKQVQFLQQVLGSGRHLLNLINDVLDLSKVEAGRMEIFPEPVALAEVIGEACAIVAPLAEQKRVTLHSSTTPAAAQGLADRKKLKQVLYNLLSNAVKFTPDGGVVTVSASAEQATLLLRVTDTGIGIRAEDLPKLFAQFQQLDSGQARRYQGTGLGLALTKRIVEFQGGTVTVASQVGQGTTFTVTLPFPPEGSA